VFRSIAITAAAVATVASLAGCGSSSSGSSATPTGSPSPAASSAHQTAAASTSAAPVTGSARCGVNLASPVIRSALTKVPIVAGTNWAWDADPASFEGNFDPCATLSTAIVTIQGATGSSPNQALMFHQGVYLGTATWKAYGFTELDQAATTADTVGLTYKTPGSCDACADGTYTHVKFHWNGTKVVMIGKPPN
jgi:hypothetical protein